MVRSALECFWISLRLGVTSFGGPVAHLGYFRGIYVERRKWLSEQRYAELVALTQFLPGPGSSQLGAAIGFHRAGWLGAFTAWLGFTLPSALLMTLFAIGMDVMSLGDGLLHGLKLAAISVVAVALLGMRKSLCPFWREMLLAMIAMIILWVMPQVWMQPLVILLGVLAGIVFFKNDAVVSKHFSPRSFSRKSWLAAVLAVLTMTAILLLQATCLLDRNWEAMGHFFNAGALVFGGGHVVLPLLEVGTVQTGMVSQDSFLAGYGAAQAVPGPLFTLASFLGGSMKLFGSVWLGGIAGTVAIFLPGMILLAGVLPVWERLKHFSWAGAGVRGANATVVGVLGAALFRMLYHGNITGFIDWAMLFVLGLTIYFKWIPIWAIVISSAVIGWLFL